MDARRAFSALVFFAAAMAAALAGPPPPNYYPELFKNRDVGVVVAKIKYTADGSVEKCIVVRSNAPFSLEASTLDFIQNHWKNPLLAGDTLTFPITFAQLPSEAKHWNDDMVPPLDPLSLGDPERKLKLRVTFGPDGWVTDAHVVTPSGLDSLDVQSTMWVRVHWHHDAYANQTVDAPFDFRPPAAPHVAPPAPPPEPVGIPAIRAQ